MNSTRCDEIVRYTFGKKGRKMKSKPKKRLKKERDIFVIGRPDIESLSKNEQRVFFSTLLESVIEYYMKMGKGKKCKTH